MSITPLSGCRPPVLPSTRSLIDRYRIANMKADPKSDIVDIKEQLKLHYRMFGTTIVIGSLILGKVWSLH